MFAASLLFAIFLLSGCNVTYPVGTLTQDLEQLIKKECKQDAKACILGKTLYLDMELEGLGSRGDKGVVSQAKMWEAVHNMGRVVLSSDANIKYTVATAYDDHKNISIVIVRNINDLRCYRAGQMSQSDYMSRFVGEVMVGRGLIEKTIKNKHDIIDGEYVGRFIASRVRSVDYDGIENQILILLIYERVSVENFSAIKKALKNEIQFCLKKYRDVCFKEVEFVEPSGKTVFTISL
jgi:hypothetical protein